MPTLNRLALYLALAAPVGASVLPSGCGGSGSDAAGATGTGATAGSGASSNATTTSASSGGSGVAGATASSGTTTSASSGTGGAGGCTQVTCQGKLYACGNCLDDDGDGLVDSADPDCLGPCDNTEDSYWGGIPGQPGPNCAVDCYFDQDSGSGNDQCYWDHRCDPNEVPPGYHPEAINGAKCAYDPSFKIASTLTCSQAYTMQSQACLDYCGPLTPNGCDCFGCCELPAGSGKYVWLGSENPKGTGSCSLATVSDASKCEPCEPVAACLNTCEHCELCVGKPTLPSDCSTGSGGSSGSGGSGGGTQCAPGVQACGLPGQAACPPLSYCITGCCIATPP